MKFNYILKVIYQQGHCNYYSDFTQFGVALLLEPFVDDEETGSGALVAALFELPFEFFN